MHSYLNGVDVHPGDVHEAAAALEVLTQRLLDAGDPRAAFADVYGIITRAVSREVLKPDGRFLEPSWIARLAGRFCERYLLTHRWTEEGKAQDCGAWRVAYASCDDDCAPPAQRVLLELSAHINYDLPIGICATIAEIAPGGAPDWLSRLHHDHNEVNALLRASFAESLDRISRVHGCGLSSLFRQRGAVLLRWGVMGLLKRWRETVWSDAMALLHASGFQRATIVGAIEARSRHIAEALYAPRLNVAACARPERAPAAEQRAAA